MNLRDREGREVLTHHRSSIKKYHFHTCSRLKMTRLAFLYLKLLKKGAIFIRLVHFIQLTSSRLLEKYLKLSYFLSFSYVFYESGGRKAGE